MKIFYVYFRQEKLLGELSEKDSQIADLEMDRSSHGASNRSIIIDKLNNEKQQIYNQLKELVRISFLILIESSHWFLFKTEIRMKIIQDHMTSKQEYEQREKSLPISSVRFI